MELITAVISGDRALEVRIFAGEFLTVQEEQALTRGLCQLLNRADQSWKRYDMGANSVFILSYILFNF